MSARRRWKWCAAAFLISVSVTVVHATAPVSFERWNQLDLQEFNNCYNYAANVPNSSFAQPGLSKRAEESEWRCDALIEAAKLDGLTFAGKTLAGSTCEPGCCRVGLALAPSGSALDATPPTVNLRDFHWYREDADGLWSHKSGGSPATRVDGSGQPIRNPELADRDHPLRTADGSAIARCRAEKPDGTVVMAECHNNYSEWCGYMCVCPGKVTLAGRGATFPIPADFEEH